MADGPRAGDGAAAVGLDEDGDRAAGGSRRLGEGGLPPAVRVVAIELRRMLAEGELDLPLPGRGRTAQRWAALAEWGGRDLSLARLAEGHVDAVAILAEAGRRPVAGALYGVWASRSGGAAVRLSPRGDAAVLHGEMRFCSGARVVDRALAVVDRAGDLAERVLVDVDVSDPRVQARPGTWCTAAMRAADTLDVAVDEVPVRAGDEVGGPGWYVARPGFVLGGGGVAAVWWGGAARVMDRVLDHLGAAPDRHALAHVGELHALLAAAEALLRRTAREIDDAPTGDHVLAVTTLRSAVERVARDVVDRAPRVVGPGPLSRDAGLAGALADLGLYVRQHHGERDYAALGEQVLARRNRA